MHERTRKVAHDSKQNLMLLSQLPIGKRARVIGYQHTPKSVEKEQLIQRLQELGFIENTNVEMMHAAPFSKDPIAVSARGTMYALRRNEAALIQVEEV